MWCSNPEGRSRSVELLQSCDRCIGTAECDRCLSVCLEEAISVGDHAEIVIDRARCDGCGDCAYACPPAALEVSGQWLSVDEVLRTVEEDEAFYARSEGGLTVSGGEPLAQGTFVVALLTEARSRGIDTAVETSGLCNWKTLQAVTALADQIFFDIKCLDETRHLEGTGVSNAKILDNFEKLRGEFPGARVTVRTPIIPGFNDLEEEIQAIVNFVQSAGGADAYELLPYHGFGEAKYAKLGKHYRLSHLRPPSEERMRALNSVATQLK
jgi:pyruvate formate lyase activating enzyme